MDLGVDANTLLVIAVVVLVVLVVTTIVRAVQIIPQATAAVVERLGRFKAVEEPGPVFLVPFVDKVRERIDLREQVRSNHDAAQRRRRPESRGDAHRP